MRNNLGLFLAREHRNLTIPMIHLESCWHCCWCYCCCWCRKSTVTLCWKKRNRVEGPPLEQERSLLRKSLSPYPENSSLPGQDTTNPWWHCLDRLPPWIRDEPQIDGKSDESFEGLLPQGSERWRLASCWSYCLVIRHCSVQEWTYFQRLHWIGRGYRWCCSLFVDTDMCCYKERRKRSCWKTTECVVAKTRQIMRNNV